MNATKKETLLQEAQMQTKALATIRKWFLVAMGVSAISMAITYYGFAGSTPHPVVGVLGIVFTVIATMIAAIINYAIRNGRRNVKKILDAIH